MKTALNVWVGIFLTLSALASEEVLTRMDLSKGTLPENWVVNPSVNPKGKREILLLHDADGAYLKSSEYLHYFFNKVYPVQETDTILVKVKGRGSRDLYIGYYIFDERTSCIAWKGEKCVLTPEWKEFTFAAPVYLYVSKTAGARQRYAAFVRPLLWTQGKDVQFKDYSIAVVRNPILRQWKIDPQESSGSLTPGKDDIAFVGRMGYRSLEFLPLSPGDIVTVELEVRGQGEAAAGVELFNLKNNRRQKKDPVLKTLTRSEKIQSGAWKTVKFTFRMENLSSQGKMRFFNRGNGFFLLNGTLELRKASCGVVKEVLAMPEI